MAKFIAELIGTLILVLFGCGAAVLGGPAVGQLGVALAFVAAAYGIGPMLGGGQALLQQLLQLFILCPPAGGAIGALPFALRIFPGARGDQP